MKNNDQPYEVEPLSEFWDKCIALRYYWQYYYWQINIYFYHYYYIISIYIYDYYKFLLEFMNIHLLVASIGCIILD